MMRSWLLLTVLCACSDGPICRAPTGIRGACTCQGGMCSEQPGCCSGRVSGSRCSGPEPAGFGLEGEETSVPLLLSRFCASGHRVTATVSVVGPTGDEVPTIEGGGPREVSERDENVGMWLNATIRPAAPGTYHFVARFQPNLGLAEQTLQVAEDRRKRAPDLVVDGAQGLARCRNIDVSETGRLLCLSPGDVRVYDRTGAELQALALSGTAARAGRAVWTYDAPVLARWLETDAGFVRSGPEVSLPSGGSATLAPEEDDVLVVEAGGRSRLVAADGGVTERPLPALDGSGVQAVWRSGVTAMLATRARLCPLGDADARCVTLLAPGGSAADGPAASDRSGIWVVAEDLTQAPSTDELSLFEPSGSRRTMTVPASWRTRGVGGIAWDTGMHVQPDSRQGLMMVSERDGAFALEKYADDALLISANSRWASFLDHGNQQLRIFRR